MHLSGTFDHTLDAKNRLTVPSKHRASLAGRVFVVKSPGACLSVYPGERYEAMIAESLEGLAPLSTRYKELRHLFNAWAEDVELDSAGRIALKPTQLDHAQIEGREVVIHGLGDCLEIRGRSAGQARDADLISRAPDLLDSLGHPA